MASGFLILPDGRCFSGRWSAHDRVLRAIASQLEHLPTAQALRKWVLEQLPGPDDEEELGYGAWWRASDQKSILRYIDLRNMIPDNQHLICEAAKRAGLVNPADEWLGELADMVRRYERGEPPLTKSHWIDVRPPHDDQRIGPG
jgi:hypothetical protein